MIPNISQLCIGYLRSGAENILDENAIGSHLLSCCCSRRVPEATNEASEKILKGLTESGSLRTGLELKLLEAFVRPRLGPWSRCRLCFR